MTAIFGSIIHCGSLFAGGINLSEMTEEFEDAVSNVCHESITENFESVVELQGGMVDALYDYGKFKKELGKNGGFFFKMTAPSYRYGEFENEWSCIENTWAWAENLENAHLILKEWSGDKECVALLGGKSNAKN